MNDTTDTDQPTTTIYELLGEQKLRSLVDRFYHLMDTVPEYYGIRKLHPADLRSSNEKLYMFLSGWLGGPQLYFERYGHPRLRARHLPYPIGIAERDQWMACMVQAMEEEGIDEGLREVLRYAFAQTADWMRNREG
ncbi:MAG: group II truncated hemoglobin [Burkholderiales bacterium]|nr:group II truncated hemoglobin [Burkholderiales bacterium]